MFLHTFIQQASLGRTQRIATFPASTKLQIVDRTVLTPHGREPGLPPQPAARPQCWVPLHPAAVRVPPLSPWPTRWIIQLRSASQGPSATLERISGSAAPEPRPAVGIGSGSLGFHVPSCPVFNPFSAAKTEEKHSLNTLLNPTAPHMDDHYDI